MELLFDRLWPLPRSLTGEGVRSTHAELARLMPLESTELASGSAILDWTVPPEWVVNEAYVVAPDGSRLLDFRTNNLHLVGYSIPFRGRLTRAELDTHLYSLADRPDAIPYVTSYYSPRWGFCMTHTQRTALADGEYEVIVDTELKQGSMTISECVLPGSSSEEILISTYTCHPSMANNELSGPVLAAFLYRRLARVPERRVGFRFVFVPETIGAIAYLHLKGEWLKRHTIAGYVVTCVGGPGGLTYKRTRDAPTLTDRVAEHVVGKHSVEDDSEPQVLDFKPTGSDERQYCSPGYRLPIGSLMRTMYGTYPEYHTSLDDKAFVRLDNVQRTLDTYEDMCLTLDRNETYLNTKPYGEPQLGRRGLYSDITVAGDNVGVADALFWVLNLSDGQHDLVHVAERSGLPFTAVRAAADALEAAGLLKKVEFA